VLRVGSSAPLASAALKVREGFLSRKKYGARRHRTRAYQINGTNPLLRGTSASASATGIPSTRLVCHRLQALPALVASSLMSCLGAAAHPPPFASE